MFSKTSGMNNNMVKNETNMTKFWGYNQELFRDKLRDPPLKTNAYNAYLNINCRKTYLYAYLHINNENQKTAGGRDFVCDHNNNTRDHGETCPWRTAGSYQKFTRTPQRRHRDSNMRSPRIREIT